ncbi:hypothetical protein NQ314_010807, partial [Rhamnusium bicolor]
VGKVWDRLFDHKGFLVGEISFMLREFEQKRGDREVDDLFRVIENITEIRDTEIDRCKQVGNQTLPKARDDLEQALNICSRFADLEEKYKQDTTIEEARNKRKIVWDNFMDGITTKYTDINSAFEAKEEELTKLYEDFEKKLLVYGNLPHGISNIVFKNKIKEKVAHKATDIDYLTTEEDRKFIKSIKLESKLDIFTKLPLSGLSVNSNDKLLCLQDLHWLYEYIQKENKESEDKIYLHELLEGSDVVLPKKSGNS